MYSPRLIRPRHTINRKRKVTKDYFHLVCFLGKSLHYLCTGLIIFFLLLNKELRQMLNRVVNSFAICLLFSQIPVGHSKVLIRPRYSRPPSLVASYLTMP